MNPLHWLKNRVWRVRSKPAKHANAVERSENTADRRALASLKNLLADESIPDTVRQELSAEYAQLERLLAKLEKGQLHVAALGRVSSGKSSLLNALLGQSMFTTHVLHGETRQVRGGDWQEIAGQSVLVLDTPGSDEAGQDDNGRDGQSRERQAVQAAQLADAVLFVLDSDLTASQLKTLRQVATPGKPVIVVLNKTDLYTTDEQAALLESITHKTAGLIDPRWIVTAQAAPRPRRVMQQANSGEWSEVQEQQLPNVEAVKDALWQLLETEGRILAALNASLFAGQISDQIAEAITRGRHQAAEKVITTFALGKAVAVAFNPVPVADLLLAGGIDVGMIQKLSRVYGLKLTRGDAARLGLTISAQLAALMGAVWGINVASAALKTVSAGLSITLTGAAQGSLAYYASYVIGRIATDYFRRGQSWGPHGPKTVAREVIQNIDRQSVLAQARQQILHHLKSRPDTSP